jgi:hypothetical protein
MDKQPGLTYTIYPESRMVHVIGIGQLKMPAMVDIVDDIAENPEFHSEFCVLFDLRDADYRAELSDGEDFVKGLMRRKEFFQGKFALLVPEHLHFLAKLYSVLAATGGFDRMKCFTDITATCEWLGFLWE